MLDNILTSAVVSNIVQAHYEKNKHNYIICQNERMELTMTTDHISQFAFCICINSLYFAKCNYSLDYNLIYSVGYLTDNMTNFLKEELETIQKREVFLNVS